MLALRNHAWIPVILAIVLLLLIASPVLGEKGKLTVNTDPDGARVFVDDVEHGTSPVTCDDLVYGEHELKVLKDGYEFYTSPIYIWDPTQQVKLILTPETGGTGSLTVITDPEGSKVSIDGIERGNGPVTIENLRYGEHSLEVEKAGYETFTSPIYIWDPTQQVRTTLEPESGVLRIQSIPTDATVNIDGRAKETHTPVTFIVGPGEHTIDISKPGYETYRKIATFDPGETVTIEVVLRGPQGQSFTTEDGKLRVGIASNPEGATVTINDAEREQKTPGIYTVPEGDVQVKITKMEYGTYDEEIRFPQESPLVVDLTPLASDYSIFEDPTPVPAYVGPVASPVDESDTPAGSGDDVQAAQGARLTIITQPDGATVTINGRDLGTTPFSTRLGPRSYNVAVSMEGYKTVQRTLDFSDQQDKEFRFALQPA